MDEKVKKAIDTHEDYQRLLNIFPLDFVVWCLTNPRRGKEARFIGNLLEKQMSNPSLFMFGIYYHELVELEEARKIGKSDEQLGESNENNPNYPDLHLTSKRKEFGFHQQIGEQVMGVKLPFLALLFTQPIEDYGAPPISYDPLHRSIQERINEGMYEYKDRFAIEDVKESINLFRLGGNKCSGKEHGLELASDYLKGRMPQRRPNIIDML